MEDHTRTTLIEVAADLATRKPLVKFSESLHDTPRLNRNRLELAYCQASNDLADLAVRVRAAVDGDFDHTKK